MKVFISHSHNDSKLAGIIKKKLITREMEVIEIDANLSVGDNLVSSIANGIKEADIYIILLTKSYVESKWTDLEQILIFDEKFSSKNRKGIFPLLIDKSITLPSLIQNYAYADLTNRDDRNRKLDELINKISHTVETKNDLSYQKMKGILREKEELLKIKELEYKLHQNKQDKLRNSFKWSFLLVTIISVIISLIFFINKFEKNSFDSTKLNIQSVVFYLLGFLTAIIPSIYIIIKFKRKQNGK